MKTLNAIDRSIMKWKNIVYRKAVEKGILDCQLCIEFYESSCEKCPIRMFTGYRYCKNTPYDDWLKTFNLVEGVIKKARSIESKNAAYRMLFFLYEVRLDYLRKTTYNK